MKILIEEMVGDIKSGRMDLFMRATGRMTKQMGEED